MSTTGMKGIAIDEWVRSFERVEETLDCNGPSERAAGCEFALAMGLILLLYVVLIGLGWLIAEVA